ncbi:ABC transporter ATP-binding protein [Plastorhodobacter daqingensis]|uniref:ABC transporter ATP-binding protein n=1 Tax=Plastorhodobacter daqingensis TaxID=1387281 RepID=A0ABW2UIL4_9RHOB
MALLELSALQRRFGATTAVDDVSLLVPDGAFLALLGPSGCGKTTLLRLIAGLERPDGGRIVIDGQIMAAPDRFVRPEARGLGMVFQSYALWPHMTVAGNIGFGLRLKGLSRAQERTRIDEALALVGLDGMGDRRPHQLSGGQRQRVALARSLALRPKLVLLDEPLANLDAHLRGQMLAEFRRLHHTLGTGFVLVTHDQDEAMAVATHVGVMNAGRLEQLATPEELFARPATPMVARFVGGGRTIPVEVLSHGAGICALFLQGRTLHVAGNAPPGPGWLCLRPANLVPDPEGPLAARVTGTLFRAGAYAVSAELEGAEDGGAVEVILPRAPRAGERLRLRLSGGWVMQREAAATLRLPVTQPVPACG